jgi:hypothetical protein
MSGTNATAACGRVSRRTLERFFAEVASRTARTTLECAFPTHEELEEFFEEVASHLVRTSMVARAIAPGALRQFFTKISGRVATAEKEQQKLDRKEATRFKVFDLIDPDENKLSDILADLLDPKGTHGQGDTFLRLLVARLERDSYPALTREAVVRREAPTDSLRNRRRRIDILVDMGLLLAIENKVDSGEQKDQVKDYLRHLANCTKANQKPYLLIYLTRDGGPPKWLNAGEFKAETDQHRLFCWNYQKHVHDWLEDCRQRCAAARFQYFLSAFITYTTTDLKLETSRDEQEPTDE